MSNFKSGSGNLDFGGSDENNENDEAANEAKEVQDEQERPEFASAEQSPSAPPEKPSADMDSPVEQSASNRAAAEEGTGSSTSVDEYPYFVRRSNVGDERDTRLEIHVRDKVADQEAKFRNELAEHLEANEISKTDAREFALLAAFHHPDRVADLMQDEGFGTIN
jgi:hypothetical protein